MNTKGRNLSNIERMAALISERHHKNQESVGRQRQTSAAKAELNIGIWKGFVIGSSIMFIVRKFIVKKNERGLLFKEGDFQRFLDPGTHYYVDPLYKMSVEVFDISVPEFSHKLSDLLIKEYADQVTKRFDKVELSATQIALVYKNARLAYVLPPASRTLFWKGLVDVSISVIDIAQEYRLDKLLAAELVYADQGLLRDSMLRTVYYQHVPEYYVGVLYVDAEVVDILKPGLHAYWKSNRNIRIEIFDTRVQEMDVTGQEILTKDKVNLRINLSASYQVKDVKLATSTLPKIDDYLYREFQFGLRSAVGTRSLDELLENKDVLDESVLAYIKAKTTELGIHIANVGVKDIILPGDMKAILAQVVEAEKSAQANSIRRREETAATRSMLNTAKVMEDNPTALRLKELETLEKVTEKVGNLSVFGGLEGLMNGLVKIG